jgi:uncharacterized membrane protein YhaH (DUF805 family)
VPTPPQFGRRGVAAAPAAPVYGAAPPKSPTPPKREPAEPAGPSPLAPMLRLFFSFEGRMRRRDYWLTQLVASVAIYAGGQLDVSLLRSAEGNSVALAALLLFLLALLIAAFWSSLATQVKRWHDRGKSWLWIFISFVPLIGGLWAFIELGFLDGDAGDNAFGPSPKWSADAVFA